MKVLPAFLLGTGGLLLTPSAAFAAANTSVASFTTSALSSSIALASLAAVFFLIRGGFQYITSSGKPEELEGAKKTIRNALIGLVVVIGAGVFSTFLQNAFTLPATPSATNTLSLQAIQPAPPTSGLTQVFTDGISGFLLTLIQSGTKPVLDGVISFLTTTPAFVTNSVVFQLWLVMVGIVDALFALIIALLGFHFMSASTFGFDEIELKHLLPRIGLAFLVANTSIFLIDWILTIANVLIQAVLAATGGLDHAWILSAFDPKMLLAGPNGIASSLIITLVFMLLFLILGVMLILFFIGRLIALSVGAVLSPFIALLWLLPGFTDFALISIKSYLILVFTVFVQVVIIQLASSFITLPGQSGTNSLIAILVGIATFFTVLKVPAMLIQFAFYSAANSAIRKLGGQILNVFSSQNQQTPVKVAKMVREVEKV